MDAVYSPMITPLTIMTDNTLITTSKRLSAALSYEYNLNK